MLENLCFSPISKENQRKGSLSIENSSLFKEKTTIRGFNFRKKQESFMKEIIFNGSLQVKNIRNFDFKQKKDKIRGIFLKKTVKIVFGEEKKKIKSFNFRQVPKKL